MAAKKLTRRKFIGGSLAFCAAGPTLLKTFAREKPQAASGRPVRRRLQNPYVENNKPVVVVVHGCDFAAMLDKAMTLLGGLAKFGADKSVIVKPNFVFDKITRYPATTDEQSVLTVIGQLKKEGFADITVADRRGSKVNGRAGGKFEWSGLNDKAEGGGFKTDSLMDNSVAEAVEVRDPRWTQLPAYGVIKKIYEAGFIINMPTIKRHTETNLTCALKNMMGVLDVPTTDFMHLWREGDKALHDSLGRDKVNQRLCRAIAEAAAAVTPELTIIDARTVLCRNHLGVEGGDPRTANRLIVSGDPLAADVVAAQVLKEMDESYDLGWSRETFTCAAQLGVGVSEPSGIVLKEVKS